MILSASNGCLLTQSGEVSIKERRFEKSMSVASMEEAARWKEVPESEKDRILAEGNLFEPEKVDYDYLTKVNRLMEGIADKINGADLTPNEALDMQRYYPQWDDCVGRHVAAGFRCNYRDTLVEVVRAHTVSEDNPPVLALEAGPALLNVDAAATSSIDKSGTVQYYKPVERQAYAHIKYSENPDGNPMTDTPSTYVGTYSDFNPEDSDDPEDYHWGELSVGHADPVSEPGCDGKGI